MGTLAGVVLINGIDVPGAIATIFTAALRTRVDNIVFTNYTASPVTLSVQMVESGGSADDTNIIVDNVTLDAHESVTFIGLLQGLAVGDTIRAVAGSANSINVRASGTTFTT